MLSPFSCFLWWDRSAAQNACRSKTRNAVIRACPISHWNTGLYPFSLHCKQLPKLRCLATMATTAWHLALTPTNSKKRFCIIDRWRLHSPLWLSIAWETMKRWWMLLDRQTATVTGLRACLGCVWAVRNGSIVLRAQPLARKAKLQLYKAGLHLWDRVSSWMDLLSPQVSSKCIAIVNFPSTSASIIHFLLSSHRLLQWVWYIGPKTTTKQKHWSHLTVLRNYSKAVWYAWSHHIRRHRPERRAVCWKVPSSACSFSAHKTFSDRTKRGSISAAAFPAHFMRRDQEVLFSKWNVQRCSFSTLSRKGSKCPSISMCVLA